jgi:hypothetical protein
MAVMMTFSLDRLTQMLLIRLGYRGTGRKNHPKLNLSALSERDLADLNLSHEVKSRFLGRREAQWIRWSR